jgi:hypothetical protein
MTDSQQDTFDSRAAYQLAIDRVLSAAKKELCIFDSNIGDLEFDSRARADALAGFLSGGQDHRLRVILHDLDHLTRYSPRLMALLKRYSHSFSVHQTPESLRGLSDRFFLADGVSGVIRFHADHYRGKVLLDQPLEIHGWLKRFEDLWLESVPGATATHLGL